MSVLYLFNILAEIHRAALVIFCSSSSHVIFALGANQKGLLECVDRHSPFPINPAKYIKVS